MKKSRPKVSIIGAGNVGSTYAFALMTRGIAREIVIVDRNEKKAMGECMDLNHGLSLTFPAEIYYGDYKNCADSDLVVITAGAKQKPGQSRVDLVQANTEIFKQIIPEVMKYAKNAVILVVSNPVDILTYATLKISGLPKNRVFGSGTVLDTSRFRYLISEHCEVDPRNVHAYIIGEHGDTELPVWSNADIGGMKIEKYCPLCKNFNHCDQQKKLNGIFEEVKNAAYKIIDAKGATYYAIALALVRITEAVLRDENSILPVSTLISDYHGVNDVCIGIPSLVNKSGVAHFLKLELSGFEQEAFVHSAETLKSVIAQIKL
ncbi:MAG: L-lactate dehydrogenase [Candidatus Omnitrophica bacterium]|nr:L-lactate dehydrogenase [Candidatus Omnitrophota bacterium]